MPLYDYICNANERTVEVSHPMRDSISTWGELCVLADLDPGSTPLESPVKKLVTVPVALAKPGSNESGSGGGCCGVVGCGKH